MYLVVWKYRVKEEFKDEFEALYGTTGGWVKWFRGSPEFIGTELVKSTTDPLVYLTIDRWQSQVAYDTYYHQGGTVFEQLDEEGARYTLEETRLGAFFAGD